MFQSGNKSEDPEVKETEVNDSISSESNESGNLAENKSDLHSA